MLIFGQFDKGGVPYVFHPFHLAEQMETEYEICVALLHDVLEDSDFSIDDLKNYGFPNEIIDAVDLLTKEKEMFIYIVYFANMRKPIV